MSWHLDIDLPLFTDSHHLRALIWSPLLGFLPNFCFQKSLKKYLICLHTCEVLPTRKFLLICWVQWYRHVEITINFSQMPSKLSMPSWHFYPPQMRSSSSSKRCSRYFTLCAGQCNSHQNHTHLRFTHPYSFSLYIFQMPPKTKYTGYIQNPQRINLQILGTSIKRLVQIT